MPKFENRTRRETTQRLIPLMEYQLAERLYDGNKYLIACELDVTLQVIEDYQQVLAQHIKDITCGLIETIVA